MHKHVKSIIPIYDFVLACYMLFNIILYKYIHISLSYTYMNELLTHVNSVCILMTRPLIKDKIQ